MAAVTPTSFWSDGKIEPKRQYRWTFTIGASGFNTWMIKSTDKPVITIGVAEHKFFGHTYKYPGNTTWNDINIVLVDPVSPDAVNALANIIYEAGYEPPKSGTVTPRTMSKEKAINKINGVSIRQVDAEGVTLETWTLNNPIIKSADFGGQLSYDNEGLIEVKMTIAYDWATLKSEKNSGANNKLELWK